MINLSYLIASIPDVTSLADCTRLCMENNIAGGVCVAWDYYSDTCELASCSLTQSIACVDYSRPQVFNGAFYGQLYQPGGPPSGYSFQVLGGYDVVGGTLAPVSNNNEIVTSQLDCQNNCISANWPIPGTVGHTTPTVCGYWTYFAPTQQCILYDTSNASLVPTLGGYTSGVTVPKTDVITELVCPDGYKATCGGIVCPTFIDTAGNVYTSNIIQNEVETDSSDVPIGWKGMCTYSGGVFYDMNGTQLLLQTYYNPSMISATCCK